MRQKNISFSVLAKFPAKVLLSFFAFFFCIGYSGNVITNASGETQSRMQISDAPQRIVVFPLFAEEMLLEMIGPKRIVYVGHEYFENGEAYSPTMALTEHNYGKYWNICDEEEILDLKPDLVVLSGGFSRDYEIIFPELVQANIAFFFLDTPETIEDIMNTLVILGEAVGAPEKAAQMMRNMEATLAQITEIVASVPEGKRVRVTHFDYSDPECFRPNNFYIIARAAGVINASGSDTDYMEMNDDLLVKWNPDLITVNPFYLDTDGSLYEIGDDYVEDSIAYLQNNPSLSNVTAIKNHNVHPLSLHESQFVVQSVMELARLAYPDLFSDKEK
jgi:ABC-type Fe3+-hydroxamate transport system substrate-binding protein